MAISYERANKRIFYDVIIIYNAALIQTSDLQLWTFNG